MSKNFSRHITRDTQISIIHTHKIESKKHLEKLSILFLSFKSSIKAKPYPILEWEGIMFKLTPQGFPGGSVVKNPPANSVD